MSVLSSHIMDRPPSSNDSHQSLPNQYSSHELNVSHLPPALQAGVPHIGRQSVRSLSIDVLDVLSFAGTPSQPPSPLLPPTPRALRARVPYTHRQSVHSIEALSFGGISQDQAAQEAYEAIQANAEQHET